MQRLLRLSSHRHMTKNINNNYNNFKILTSQTTKFCSTEPSNANVGAEYSTIYKMPYAQVAAVINRLKLHQTCITICGIPTCFLLEGCGSVPDGTLMTCMFIGLASSVAFYSIGQFLSDLVGYMYINNRDPTKMKISYVGFFGKREDFEIPVRDIRIPLESHQINSFYNRVLFNQSDRKLKINLKYALIDEEFFTIFGDRYRSDY